MSHGAVFEKRLVLVGPEMLERLQPLLGGPLGVEGALLDLGLLTDTSLDLGITDDDELPRLTVRAIGRRTPGEKTLLDDVAGNRAGREVANGTSTPHALQKGFRRGTHLLRRLLLVGAERYEAGSGHNPPLNAAKSRT